MRTLNGSEKQIAWAEKIIAEAYQRNEREMREAQERFDRFNGNPAYPIEQPILNIRKAIYAFVAEELNKISSAKVVIDNRQSLKAYVIEKDVDAFMVNIGREEAVVDDIIAVFAKDGTLNINEFLRWAI